MINPLKIKSKAIGTRPCPSCRAQGRDRTGNNLVLYKDNSGFCFVCDKRFADVDNDHEEVKVLSESHTPSIKYTKEYVPHRGLTKATLQTYGVSVRVDPQSEPQWIEFPYGPDGRKLKGFKEKKFFFEGSAATALPLFGMDKFGAASARAITLTEGEHDALAAYQMLGSKYPVVSVRSSGEALKNCQDSYDYLNSFDKIYICFDNDDPGHKATKEVASLFDPSKTYIVNLSQHKDANDYLVNNKTDEFTKTWWNSKKYIPKGIVSEFSSVEEALKKKSAEPVGSYPFATLDSMTYGIRLGEINLFTAQEKIGKQLSLDTILPTPEGWTTVGELKGGDYLIGKDGSVVNVTYVTEIRTRPYYKVSFSDGTFLEAADDHRWTVRDLNNNVSVVNTQTMVNDPKGLIAKGSKARYMVPVMEAARFPEKSLPIDPFLLGVWLADGHSYSSYICLSDTKLERMGDYTIKTKSVYKDRIPNYSFEELTHALLDSNNLLKNKHIPSVYLRSSVSQREALFRGLCFDGWTRTSKGKQENEFYSSNETLFNQVVELARSLGYIVTCNSRQGKYKDKDSTEVVCKKAYSFRYRRAAWKAIRSIAPIDNKEGRCLTVDHPDHLFVAGDGWTLTHNTEIFRAIEHHLLKTTNERLGLIHLEEDDRRTICGLVGYEAKVPAHLPDSGLSDEDKLKIYKDLVKTDDRVFMYSHFGSDDPNTILSVIRYLVQGCKCKFVFLDHITMLATGFEDDDERKKLDFISTRLAMMVRELDFTMFMISHVNDDGKTRGSRNISKVADLIVSINRDKESEDPEVRNTTKLMVLGNRFGSTSGPAGLLRFDTKTFTLHEMNESEKTFAVHEF